MNHLTNQTLNLKDLNRKINPGKATTGGEKDWFGISVENNSVVFL